MKAGKKMLLLFSSTLTNGGIQRFNRTLLASCARLDLSCSVLSLLEPDDAANQRRFGAHIRFRSFDGSRFRYAMALVKAVWSGCYESILVGHINLLALAVLVAVVCPRRTPRLILVAHGIEVWSGIDGLRRRALQRLSRILCVSTYTKNRILEQAPLLVDARLVVFPNALSESWSLSSESDSAPLARRLPDKFILSVTRLDSAERYKGVLAVLEAVAMLEDRSIHYVVAGDGNDLNFLQRAALHLGIDARVHFLRALSDEELKYLYRRCLSFILPSGREGFGIVYLEAMFFAAPVIAAREKGVIDVVKDGESGLLVNYGDTIAIAAALEKLIADGELRARLVAAARKLVTAGGPFTFSAFTARLAAVFDANHEPAKKGSFPEVHPVPQIESD